MNDAGFKRWQSRLEEDRRAIAGRLEKLLPAPDEPPASLHEAMRYSTLGGGKRLRGVLCLGAHRLFRGASAGAALDAACAIEALHAYTLIHDDLPDIDNDDVRRGRPACHRAFGNAVALLAGDALQAFAFDVLSRCEAEPSAVVEALRILARAAGSRFLVGGQVADMEWEGAEPSAEKVMFVHSRKTAALIGASLGVGAALAGAPDSGLAEIEEIGRAAGLAFQIVDDLLDVEGSEEKVGKGLRKDVKRKKMTYPAQFGVEPSRETARRLIAEANARIGKLGDEGYVEYLLGLIIERVS
jgi:geranylgeranyl diphosphate synthase, type II